MINGQFNRVKWVGISLGFLLLGLSGCTSLSLKSSAIASALTPLPSTSPAPSPELQYEVRRLSGSEIHVLRIPAGSGYRVTVGLTDGVASLEDFARHEGAIAVLNAGFFDPANQKTTSYISLGGQVVADPQQNERLVNNPNLAPYLASIFNRSEFRQYQCGDSTSYAIAPHNDPSPPACSLVAAVGAGPQLLPENTAIAEAFVDPANGRDALGSTRPNARTAVGILPNGDVIWVMAAQTSPTSGISLPALAQFMQSLGATAAMNLDGGSSSSLYYQGETLYGKLDADGNRIRRPVKSVLILQRAE